MGQAMSNTRQPENQSSCDEPDLWTSLDREMYKIVIAFSIYELVGLGRKVTYEEIDKVIEHYYTNRGQYPTQYGLPSEKLIQICSSGPGLDACSHYIKEIRRNSQKFQKLVDQFWLAHSPRWGGIGGSASLVIPPDLQPAPSFPSFPFHPCGPPHGDPPGVPPGGPYGNASSAAYSSPHGSLFRNLINVPFQSSYGPSFPPKLPPEYGGDKNGPGR